MFYNIFEHELFKLGSRGVRLIDVFIFIAAFALFIALSSALRRYVVSRLLERARFRAGTNQFAGVVAQYAVILLGFIVALQIVGVDLTSLTVLAGAVGVAIGVGLQPIAVNFISGLVLIFENPFQVGDRIETGNVTGKVTEIGGRSTKITADDETVHIIPNQKLITENVRSFARLSQHLPHEIKIFVAYGTDVAKVLDILRRVAERQPQILAEPAPAARLKAFDANKIDFILSFATAKDLPEIENFTSGVNTQIYEELSQNGITLGAPAVNVVVSRAN